MQFSNVVDHSPFSRVSLWSIRNWNREILVEFIFLETNLRCGTVSWRNLWGFFKTVALCKKEKRLVKIILWKTIPITEFCHVEGLVTPYWHYFSTTPWYYPSGPIKNLLEICQSVSEKLRDVYIASDRSMFVRNWRSFTTSLIITNFLMFLFLL